MLAAAVLCCSIYCDLFVAAVIRCITHCDIFVSNAFYYTHGAAADAHTVAIL